MDIAKNTKSGHTNSQNLYSSCISQDMVKTE